MPLGYDPDKFKRITTIVTHEVIDRIDVVRAKRGILRETFIREAIEAHLRSAEQSNG